MTSRGGGTVASSLSTILSSGCGAGVIGRDRASRHFDRHWLHVERNFTLGLGLAQLRSGLTGHDFLFSPVFLHDRIQGRIEVDLAVGHPLAHAV